MDSQVLKVCLERKVYKVRQVTQDREDHKDRVVDLVDQDPQETQGTLELRVLKGLQDKLVIPDPQDQSDHKDPQDL